MAPRSPLQVGVLFADDMVQLTDIAPVDTLTMITPEYVSEALESNFPHLQDQVVPMNVSYIHEKGEGLVKLTASAKLSITHSLSNAPPLDILIIPGSAPIITARPAIDAFIQSAAAHGTTILCICTGIFPTAASGVLEGRAATGPLVMLSTLRAQHPEIQWNNTRRWEKSVGTAGSGDIWTSGSIANGVDLMCAFMRERFSESKELMDMMIKLATIPERESAYNEKERALETLFEETG